MKTMRANIIQAFVLIMFSAMAYAADLHVPADYATIQAAADAAVDGDTIHIAPGIYIEQVYIHQKNLNLIGQPGTILRAFPGMAPGGGYNNWNPIVYIQGSTNCTVHGLTFEGDQLADQQANYGLGGLYFLDSGGTVENCRFTGFREGVAGNNGSFALRMWNDLPGASLLSARVIDNVIVDSYIGISVIGAPTNLSYNFIISNNTVRGVGPIETGGINGTRGIRIGSGAKGSVVGNTVSDFAYLDDPMIVAEFPFAWGIIAEKGYPGDFTPLEPIRFENNTLSNNNLHMILLEADNNEVVNNHFKGTGPSQRMAGLWISGDNIQVAGNVFEEMEAGIRVGGNDPDFGTALGIANNAMLNNNRFREVITTIEIQTMATATEQGSLLYPYPQPVLNIRNAVLLSWPEVEEGFSVESAPTMDGPWNPLDATVFLEDGMHSAMSPTDSEHMFFRLIEQP